jgi:hypothetical protein
MILVVALKQKDYNNHKRFSEYVKLDKSRGLDKVFDKFRSMNIVNLVYITISTTLFVLAVSAPVSIVQSQEDDDEDAEEREQEQQQQQLPTGEIVNGKYLTISGVTFKEDDNQVNIDGIIANNSTDQSFTNVAAVGQLYDEDNRLITASYGIAGLANLGPGQQSAFTITTNLPSDEEIVHYTVLPGGSGAQ